MYLTGSDHRNNKFSINLNKIGIIPTKICILIYTHACTYVAYKHTYSQTHLETKSKVAGHLRTSLQSSVRG